jgi:hypothetical protein
MKPHSIGRALGIGLRIAGRIAGEQAAGSSVAQRSASTAAQTRAAAQPGASAAPLNRAAGQAAKGLARGIGGFLRPFARVGGILWLEVAGVFFLLPVIVFAPTLWRFRASWLHGPDHRTFLVTAGIIVVFFYLSVSSFWRARRK